MKKRIDQYSFGYDLLKYVIAKPIFKSFYKKIEVVGAEKIKKGESIIFAPNHQNALMDAMSLVLMLKKQTVFMARADIFKTPFLVKFLTFIKILPAYRMRDGISNLQKNDGSFDATVAALQHKENPICVFPEGNHGPDRRLRGLVKGIFRIAFMAQEPSADKPMVKMYPVGIDYGHYHKYRTTLLVNIGEPIEVSKYWEAYAENQPVGINQLRDALAERMKELMVHIETKEHYELFFGLKNYYNEVMRENMGLEASIYNSFLAGKEITEGLDRVLKESPHKIESIETKFKKYEFLLKKLNLRDWVVSKKSYSVLGNAFLVLLSLISLPLVLFGLIHNGIQFFLPPMMSKNIKDKQFKATFHYGMAMPLVWTVYIIFGILGLVLLPAWWMKIAYLLLMPFSAVFTFSYWVFLKKTWAKIRFGFNRKRKDYQELIALRKSLFEELDGALFGK